MSPGAWPGRRGCSPGKGLLCPRHLLAGISPEALRAVLSNSGHQPHAAAEALIKIKTPLSLQCANHVPRVQQPCMAVATMWGSVGGGHAQLPRKCPRHCCS